QMVDRGGRLLSELNARDGEDLVLFGHADALRALAAAYLGHPPEICHHLTLNVASISILGWRHQWPAIICWNLT
ncbi:MAG: histidine phosphatase family protein, partial [Candidatus Dormibacteria bacterium]